MQPMTQQDFITHWQELGRISQLMERGIFTEKVTQKPYFTGYSYETLYDWDQYFEAIVQRYLGWDSVYIKNGVTIFLDYQKDNGHIQRSTTGCDEQLSEHVKPFLSQIVLLLYKSEKSIAFITTEYYEKLKKYLNYWLFDLDANANNLSVWDSGPHTGMDNQHERAGWWYDRISEGVDLNSYLYRECLAFSRIAEIVGRPEDCAFYLACAGKVKNAVQELLWDEQDGFYYDRHEKTGEPIRVKHVGGFAPLWAGIATKEQAARLVSDHLLNPDEFWRRFPLPALAATEPGYSEAHLPNDLGCSWRAQTWIPTNYYVFQGLRRYGYTEIAKELADKTYEMVRRIGDREYYNTESLTGNGLDPFWGWSLLAYFMPMEAQTGYDPTNLDYSLRDLLTLSAR